MTLTPLQPGDARDRALRFNSRERRASLAGFPELSRTLELAIPTATVAAASLPGLTRPFAFRTKIRVTGAAPTGLIFELGNATTAIAAWVTGTTLEFRAGGAAAADRGLATFTPSGGWATGRELDLLFAVLPGDGRVRIYGNGLELARGVASGGAFPAGWAAASNGAFAAAATGALPADVTETGAPTNFDVVERLSAFNGQAPRHFV